MAAGSGTRLGADVPKAFVRVAGRTLLSYAVERASRTRGLVSLALVLPDGWLPDGWLPDGDAYDHEISRHAPVGTSFSVGGAERTDSVRIGLERLDPACDVVLIHDAARAFTPTAVFDRVVDAVRSARQAGAAVGAVPGLPVVDTVKSVDSSGVITGTPDRSRLRAVQTPQGFDAEVLRAAYASGLEATDDAALVEALGRHVLVVDGDPLARKVTTPDDLDWAVHHLG
ncbi:MAG: 2-C-methyl-D-erythritol 4-phosphate cytidylyltransferase [Micrococcales bacterium]|nr:2-C-methyl-D-erythritol 4-phosphate cytidylyltransferase [Micrococcales bacterium]